MKKLLFITTLLSILITSCSNYRVEQGISTGGLLINGYKQYELDTYLWYDDNIIWDVHDGFDSLCGHFYDSVSNARIKQCKNIEKNLVNSKKEINIYLCD
jgi:hypothetical protein